GLHHHRRHQPHRSLHPRQPSRSRHHPPHLRRHQPPHPRPRRVPQHRGGCPKQIRRAPAKLTRKIHPHRAVPHRQRLLASTTQKEPHHGNSEAPDARRRLRRRL